MSGRNTDKTKGRRAPRDNVRHTTGPWSAIGVHYDPSGERLGLFYVVGPGVPGSARHVAIVQGMANDAERDANARLIASAPELLEALRRATADCGCSLVERDSGHMVDCFAPDACAAIAKAEGR